MGSVISKISKIPCTGNHISRILREKEEINKTKERLKELEESLTDQIKKLEESSKHLNIHIVIFFGDSFGKG